MSLSNEQSTAFQLNGGFTPEQLGMLVIGFVFAVVLVWGAWAIATAYSGWANEKITRKEFVAVVVRFVVIYAVLGIFLIV